MKPTSSGCEHPKMNPGSGNPIDPTDLRQVEADLRTKLSEIEERLREMKKPPPKGSAIGFGKRVGDGTTEAVSRFADVGVANSLEGSAADIQRALQKLEEGTYGQCDDCGQPIAAGRLKVAPASSQCIECARRRPRG